MSIRVKDVLKFSNLSDLNVIAGHKGMDEKIRLMVINGWMEENLSLLQPILSKMI